MLFVSVHCEDEIDRSVLIPLSRVRKVCTNADGSDTIITVTGEAYTPRVQDNFYLSIEDIKAEEQE